MQLAFTYSSKNVVPVHIVVLFHLQEEEE